MKSLNNLMYTLGFDMYELSDLIKCKAVLEDCVKTINSLLELEKGEREAKITAFDEAELGILE